MLKFFRRIRQTLLSENKFSKYLLYAIGEIILVVVGILIALQINTWNEQQNNNQKEQALLKEIHREFVDNKTQLDRITKLNKEALLSCDSLLSKYPLQNDPSSVNYLIRYMDRAFQNYTFNPTDGTINAIINSSTFNLIKNDTLRRYLISWNGLLEDYLEEEQNAIILLHEVYPFLRNNITKNDPFSAQNLKVATDFRVYNFLVDRKYDLQSVINATDDEGLNEAINEIIRLTKTKAIND